MRRLITSKPILIAGALAARQKMIHNRAKRRRRKTVGVTLSILAMAAAGTASYRLFITRRRQQDPREEGGVQQNSVDRRNRSSIRLEAPEPAPNI